MPISCQLYDTIEIVCMHHYSIVLKLNDGSELSGVAQDTKAVNGSLLGQQYSGSKHECIELAIDGSSHLVVLSTIDTMIVTTENPHVQQVRFN